MVDYYNVLGLSHGASQDDIKASFRKLALAHHPDRHVSSTAAKRAEASNRFKAITEAYEVLTDDRKRAAYHASRSGGGGGGSYYGAGGGSGGSSRRQQQQQRYSQQYSHTDWARSQNAGHGYDPRTSRASWWHTFSRRISSGAMASRAEMVAAVGLSCAVLLGIPAVDALWEQRNRGKHFKDIHATTTTTKTSLVGEPTGRPRAYTPVGCGTTAQGGSVRSLFGRRNADQEAQAAAMPLAQLVALEEAAEAAGATAAGHGAPAAAAASARAAGASAEGLRGASLAAHLRASQAAARTGGAAGGGGGDGAPSPAS